MPYIEPLPRRKLAPELCALNAKLRDQPKDELDGDVNYIITCIISRVLLPNEPHYVDYEKAIGLLECAKLELYRRKVAPYEDSKRDKNGEVY